MIKASIIGGSGYVGGELLRLLLFHPNVNVVGITSGSIVVRVSATCIRILRILLTYNFRRKTLKNW